MAIADNHLIEQIVANVLAELQPAPAVRAAVAPSSPPLPAPKSETQVVELDLPVITADLLAERVRPAQSVRIGRRSILTPSARDWLGSRKVSWSRVNGSATSGTALSARWQLILTTVTPAVSSLRQSLIGWKTELLGTPREAADYGIRVICTGEADGVLTVCGAAETVACLANRNPKLRAAVLSSTAELSTLVKQLGPNLLAINPQGKSFVELRNLFRSVAGLGKPVEPVWR
ncbi:MAG: hypothetical protein U0872_01630 [Planctomycetaceae bacterium]